MCVDVFVLLQKAHITANSENVPDSQSSIYRLKQVLIFEEIHIT